MKNLLFLASFLVLFTSCKNKVTEQEKSPETKINLVSVDDIYSNPELYTNQELKIQGMVTHVCKHGGQKLFITGENDSLSLRIDVGESIAEFDINLEGSVAVFSGILELMDENFVVQAQAEHNQHHPEDAEEGEHDEGNVPKMDKKNYHLIASSFKTL